MATTAALLAALLGTAAAAPTAAPSPAAEVPAAAAPASEDGRTVRVSQKKHQRGPDSQRDRHSLTLAPFRTSWPAVHLRYEARLRPKLGLDLAAGMGQWRPMAVRVASNLTDVDIPEISLKEAEVALSTYPAGHFDRGMQLGVTVRHQWASTAAATTSMGAIAAAQATATVFTVGPHIGLKRIWNSGFTLQARVGAGYAMANADVEAVAMFGPMLGTEQLGGSYGGPIVFGSAGLGWSF